MTKWLTALILFLKVLFRIQDKGIRKEVEADDHRKVTDTANEHRVAMHTADGERVSDDDPDLFTPRSEQDNLRDG